MTQLVINLSRVTQQVGIIDEQGRRTSFRLMARGRVETNYDIDPNWMAHNPGAIRVITIEPPVETAPQEDAQPVITSTSKSVKKAEKEVTSIESDNTAEGAQ
jgi:hypothetical protein